MIDGQFIVYLVQHKDSKDDWNDSDLSHFLFASDMMSFEERQGEKGDVYRKLLSPQHACWQRTRIDGFLDPHDARAALGVVRSVYPTREFRLVRRFYARMTEVVER